MGETTGIEWADSTLNIWMGCQETGSPACVGCYARQLVEGRFGLTTWGPHGKRVETKSWRSNLRKISRLAKAAGRPWFVFVNSLSDFWDNQADPKLRAEALAEFAKHPHLTFLLLTKRPQNIVKLFRGTLHPNAYRPDALHLHWPSNVAIGCTVVTQAEANRDVPHLLRAAATLRPAFTFLSIEPMQEFISLRAAIMAFHGSGEGAWDAALALDGIGWVIAGGGTDQGRHMATPTHVDWYRDLRTQCAYANTPFMFKQWGEWVGAEVYSEERDGTLHGGLTRSQVPGQSFGGKPTHWWSGDAFGGVISIRTGKKRAGRMLDGRTHDERPKVSA